MKTIKAVIEKGSDNNYAIYLPSVAGIYGTGKTEQEAKQELQNAIEMALEYVKETGNWGEYVALSGKFTIEYNYDLSGFFKTFNFFDVTALAKVLEINPSLLRRYKSGLSKASETQRKRIERGIHTISKQLSSTYF